MKTIVKVSVILLLLMAVGLVVLSVFLNSTIKVAVERIGPTITGTEVTLEEVDLSLFTGEGRLEKLVIGNPQGFRTDHAFHLGVVYIKADLKSLWSDTVRIQEILIESPEISYEGTQSGSNIGIIHKHVDSFARSTNKSVREKNQQGRKAQGQPSSEKKIQIDQFILKNARVTVGTPLLQERLLTIILPVVQIRDIGKRPVGATLKDIAPLIYSETQKAIEQEIAKKGILVGPHLKKLDKELGGIIKEASKFLEIFK